MNKKKIICSFVVAFGLILTFTDNYKANAASISTLSWDLVDSGKHLDWDGSSAYLTSFTQGVSVWNAYKPGVIRKDTVTIIEDVTISDYSEASNTAAVTSSRGTIKFNKYNMAGYSSTKRKNVAIHEIGHALGLDHNKSSDVMYAYVSNNVTLSANDKASYDSAYKKY